MNSILVKTATITWADGTQDEKRYGTLDFYKQRKKVEFELGGEVTVYSFSEIQKIELEDGMVFQLQNLSK